MKKQIRIITILVTILIVLIIGIMSTNLVFAQNTGSISGKVTPTEAGIEVIAIQNLSLIAKTITDENGNYKIEYLEPGNYGLLFISPNGVYVYNDEINSGWVTDLKETISFNTTGIDINLDSEWADYFSGRIIVQFKSDVSEEKILEITNSCNCNIKEKLERSYGIYYILNTPDDKTILEIVRDFNLNENIEVAEPDIIVRVGDQNEKNLTEKPDNQTGEDEEELEGNSFLWFLVLIPITILIIILYLISKKK